MRKEYKRVLAEVDKLEKPETREHLDTLSAEWDVAERNRSFYWRILQATANSALRKGVPEVEVREELGALASLLDNEAPPVDDEETDRLCIDLLQRMYIDDMEDKLQAMEQIRGLQRYQDRATWHSRSKAGCSGLALIMTVAAIMALLTTMPVARAFEAYDCEDPQVSITDLDLTEVESCPDPVKDYAKPQDVKVQLLSRQEKLPITGYRCFVTYSKRVGYCGFDHISYGDEFIAWKKVSHMTPGECRRAVSRGLVKFEGKMYHVVPGVPKSIQYYSHGRYISGGRCETSSFVSEGQTFTSSHETVMADFTVEVVRGVHNRATEEVRFDNGVTAPFKDGVLRDYEIGVVVWNTTEAACKDTLSQIYSGPARIHRKKEAGDVFTTNAIVIIANETTRQYAAMVLVKPRSICSTHCWDTQTPGFLLCISREKDDPIAESSFKAHFNLEAGQLHSQLSYQIVSRELSEEERFELLQGEACETQGMVLQTRLQAIAGSANPYSLVDLKGKGRLVEVQGAVAYITKCVPVDVVKTEFPNCTTEIPVRYRNQTRFVDPITLILQRTPEVKPCTAITPVKWKIQGQWYCSDPVASKCTEPEKLAPATTVYKAVDEIAKGIADGAYSPHQKEQRLMSMWTSQGRRAVLTSSTANALNNAGRGDTGIFIGSPLSPADMSGLIDRIGSSLLPLYGFLGFTFPYIIGGMMLAAIISYVVGALARLCFLLQQKGCGWHVIWAASESLFAVIQLPVRIMKGAFGSLDPQVEHDRQRKILDDQMVYLGNIIEDRITIRLGREGLLHRPRPGILKYGEEPRYATPNKIRSGLQRSVSFAERPQATEPPHYADLNARLEEESSDLEMLVAYENWLKGRQGKTDTPPLVSPLATGDNATSEETESGAAPPDSGNKPSSG